jgi:deazaflavin-dependent oxidoreductase (nitroreductase family)
VWITSSKRGWGAIRLTAIGRKSGQERSVIIGYVEDGPNLVAIAMNGWDEGHPSWWLNLPAHPDAVVRLAGQAPRRVRARPGPRAGTRSSVAALGHGQLTGGLAGGLAAG